MATIPVNGIDMYYESQGDGESLVLLHGAFNNHGWWALMAPALATSYRVVTCDLRGHGTTPIGKERVRFADHVADVGALIDGLDLAPAHLVGYSLGATIALRLATERPELVASVCAHEPGASGAMWSAPEVRASLEMRQELFDVQATVFRLFDRIAADPRTGIDEFIEWVAPGRSSLVPSDVRDAMIAAAPANAPIDLESSWLDLDALARFSGPVTVSVGDATPAEFFRLVARAVADTVPSVRHHTIAGAGHVPVIDHAAEWVEIIRSVATPAGVLAGTTSAP